MALSPVVDLLTNMYDNLEVFHHQCIKIRETITFLEKISEPRAPMVMNRIVDLGRYLKFRAGKCIDERLDNKPILLVFTGGSFSMFSLSPPKV